MTAVLDIILPIALMIGASVLLIAVVGGGAWAYLWYKRFSEYQCIIFEKGKRVSFDSAGIFVDKKTNAKRFFLKKNKGADLDPNNVPYQIGTDGKRYVLLLRDGLKNFRYMDFNGDHDDIVVGEEDLNWAINGYERAKSTFAKSLWMQLLPYLIIVIPSIIILIIFIYFFKSFDVLADVAVALKEAAQAMSQASSGTTVITGG